MRTALLALAFWLLPDSVQAQTSCTTKTDCLDVNIVFEDDPPSVTVFTLGDSLNAARQKILVRFGDDAALDANSASLSVTPGAVVAAGTWVWTKEPRSASREWTVDFAPGVNTIIAGVCDIRGTCSADTTHINYSPTPVLWRVPPTLTNAYSGERRNFATCDACAEAVLSYSTPSYVSLDQSRSVTLFYWSGQARPLGYVEVDAHDASYDPPVQMSIKVTNPWGYVVAAERFYTAGSGTQRLAAVWDGGSYGTSAKMHTVAVRSYWSDGTFQETTIPVRVVIIDERASRFGSGWTMAGLQRLHVGPDGVLVTDGAGSAVFFAQRADGSFVTPPGEPSQLGFDGTGGYLRTYADGTKAYFNGSGYIQRVRDRFGNETTYGWTVNAEGVPVPHRITDPVGNVTTLNYNTATGPHYGKLGSIVDPTGRATWFGYWDGWENLTDIQDAASGAALKVTYDPSVHLATSWTDVWGGKWDLAYDAAGRVARVEAPVQSDGTTSGRQVTTIRSREAAALTQPGMGWVQGSPSRRVVPDSAALVITPPIGASIRILSDAFGGATLVAGPRDTIRTRRNARGQVEWRQDSKGNAVKLEYKSAYPYLVRSVDAYGPDGSMSQTIQYGVFSQPSKITVGDNPWQHVSYEFLLDPLGRDTAVLRGGTTIASYRYDGRSRVTSATDAGGHTASFTYHPAPGMQNLATATANGATTQYRYDAAGRTVQTVTNGIASDSVAYDVLNRPTSVRDPAGATTFFHYPGSRPAVYDVIDALSQRYRTVRNTLGQVTQETDPAGNSAFATYYPATGLPRSITNRRAGVAVLEYDGEGRLTRRTADGAEVRWDYDPDRRWMAATSPVSTDTIRYDGDGKMVESVTRRGGLRFSIRQTYTSLAQPDSVVVSGPWGTRYYQYGYDGRGRLDAIRDYSGKWTHIRLGAEGFADSVRLPTAAAMRLSFGYTPGHQLAAISAPPASLNHEYRYDGRGLMRADSAAQWKHAYGYDALDRIAWWELVKTTFRHVCYDPRNCGLIKRDSLAHDALFAWDAVGNPQGAPRAPGNRLLAHGGFSMAYDADGNLTRKYNASGFDQTFTWNTLGQLTGVSRAGVGSVTYDYDGFGRRVRRVNHATGAVVHYVYDGDDLALEVDAAGNLLREYSYYPGIDAPHSMRQWANGAGGAIYYYALQPPGHVNGLVNANDQLVNSYRYTPFGAPASGSPIEGTENPLQYMARELDAATGLYYVRNRWYDPQVGRFISEDPIGLAGGINMYSYAGNNPLSFRDPSGLSPCFSQLVTSFMPRSVQRATYLVCDQSWAVPLLLFGSTSSTLSDPSTWRIGTVSDVQGGGSGGGVRHRIRDWASCVAEKATENHDTYTEIVEWAASEAVGAAGDALLFTTRMAVNGELGFRGLQGSGLTTTRTFNVAGRWALNRSWEFATPTMVQGISVGTRHVTAFAFGAAAATNLAVGLALTGAWKGGVWVGSGLVGIGACM